MVCLLESNLLSFRFTLRSVSVNLFLVILMAFIKARGWSPERPGLLVVTGRNFKSALANRALTILLSMDWARDSNSTGSSCWHHMEDCMFWFDSVWLQSERQICFEWFSLLDVTSSNSSQLGPCVLTLLIHLKPSSTFNTSDLSHLLDPSNFLDIIDPF